jgi:dTDP-4-amino-4,6-dideoxygalactose transaminase
MPITGKLGDVPEVVPVKRRMTGHPRSQPARRFRQKPLIGLVNRTIGLDDALLAQRLLRELHAFEHDFHQLPGAPAYVTAWSSGRVALSAGLQALDLQRGDDVLVPGYTCVVVANALRYAGLNPVFVDIELDTFGPALDSVRERTTSRTRAVIVQHLYGLVARDHLEISAFCEDRGIKLIEDCAHSTGAMLHDRMVGAGADLAIYSSEQSKAYSTIQGGVAATRDPDVHVRLQQQWAAAEPSGREFTKRLLRNVQLAYLESTNPMREVTGVVGRRLWEDTRLISTPPAEERGIQPDHYGRRMSAPVAALASNQLRKLAENNEKRRHSAERWAEWAAQHGYARPAAVDGSRPTFLRYPVLVPAAMKQDTSWGQGLGVEVGVWFQSQLHPAPGVIESCPNALYAVEHCVNLPTL